MKYLQDTKDNAMEEQDEDPCEKGYEMLGMKTQEGEKVPNCIPEDEI